MERDYEQLSDFMEEHKGENDCLISVLHKAQDIFGELNEEVQLFVAEGLGIPLIDVYGVATFYAQFTLQKKGKYKVGVCLGTTCYVVGAEDVIHEIEDELGIEVGETTKDGLFTLEAPRCIGACGLAPLVSINDEIYGKLVPGQIKTILQKYRA